MEEWKRKKRELESESVRKQEKMVDQYVIYGGMEEEEEESGEGKRTRSRENGGLVRNLRKNEKRKSGRSGKGGRSGKSGKEMERAARQNELRAGCV